MLGWAVEMDVRKKVLVLVALAVVGGAGGALFAVLRGPETPDVRAWLLEYDSLQQGLETLRDRAFQDVTVARERAELNEAITARMRASVPAADSLLARADTLETEMDHVRAGQELDPREYTELLQEYETIRAALGPAERAAFLDPEIQARFETFRRLLEAKMIEMATPEERAALRRIGEIEARIEAIPPEVFDSLTRLPAEGE